ncbi:N-acetylneuraminate synthase family protein [Candidatus Peregrinibacteria bacterium]|nr:N-acetylneuraminate synthase family protein [Candidatus Peregrinibacteria bacterium]
MNPIKIRNRLIGPDYPPYIVAEAAINHEGDIKIAKRMVYIAHALGADAIKFQIHVLENEMLKEAPQSENFAEPLYDTLKRTNLSLDEHRELKQLCETIGIQYLCTPFSRDGVDLLEQIGVDAFKIGSGELTNLPLQEHIAKKGKPMIISTGMCTVEEIRETVELVRSIGTPFILTHCVSAYPTPYHRVNLKMIQRYQALFQVPVGISDHSEGIYTVLGAVALGACFIEKHFTLNKLAKGPDHPVSIEPQDLLELVKGANAIYQALGETRDIFPEEQQIVAWARHSVVSEKHIPRGTTIAKDMIWVKRPGPQAGAVPAKSLREVIGRKAKVDIPAGIQIKWEYII